MAVLGGLGGRLRALEVIQKAFLQYPLAFFLVFMKKCYTVVTFRVKCSKSAIRYAKIASPEGSPGGPGSGGLCRRTPLRGLGKTLSSLKKVSFI